MRQQVEPMHRVALIGSSLGASAHQVWSFDQQRERTACQPLPAKRECLMEINRTAPAIAQGEIAIHAPLDTVWSIHTDIDRWSEWNSSVRRSRLEGPLAAGAVFRWVSGGASIISTLQQVDPMRTIAWTGRAMGARASHVWTFEREGDAVIVHTTESFNGWWPRLFPDLTRGMLENILSAWLQALKQQAEADTGHARDTFGRRDMRLS
jgi:hypothetical protein